MHGNGVNCTSISDPQGRCDILVEEVTSGDSSCVTQIQAGGEHASAQTSSHGEDTTLVSGQKENASRNGENDISTSFQDSVEGNVARYTLVQDMQKDTTSLMHNGNDKDSTMLQSSIERQQDIAQINDNNNNAYSQDKLHITNLETPMEVSMPMQSMLQKHEEEDSVQKEITVANKPAPVSIMETEISSNQSQATKERDEMSTTLKMLNQKEGADIPQFINREGISIPFKLSMPRETSVHRVGTSFINFMQVEEKINSFGNKTGEEISTPAQSLMQRGSYTSKQADESQKSSRLMQEIMRYNSSGGIHDKSDKNTPQCNASMLLEERIQLQSHRRGPQETSVQKQASTPNDTERENCEKQNDELQSSVKSRDQIAGKDSMTPDQLTRNEVSFNAATLTREVRGSSSLQNDVAEMLSTANLSQSEVFPESNITQNPQNMVSLCNFVCMCICYAFIPVLPIIVNSLNQICFYM